jgi:S1-C subfamily serine protease
MPQELRPMRLVSALVVAVTCTISSAVLAGPFSLSGDARWIALASRQDLDEAIGVARAYRWQFPTIRVMQAANGWFAVVAGPERVPNARTFKDNLLSTGGVPKDLLLSKGDAYVSEVWRPSQVVMLGEAKFEGIGAATLRVGDLTVTVTSVPEKGGTGRFPVATAYQSGRLAFTMRLDENSSSEAHAQVTAIRLDAGSREPQIVFTSHWGGAHCCTMTKIATSIGGTWWVVTGRTLDGEGYGFEDIDGDDSYELVSVDNSFLYAFAPYAGSWAPHRVSKLTGERIIDVTREPPFQAYNRQQLYRQEYSAALEPEHWRSNGFLAAWIATKALVGEFEDAWSRMLPLYERSSDWPLTECTVAQVSGLCPEGKERTLTFPVALRKHLEEQGYIPRSPAPPRAESVAAIRPAPIPPSTPPKQPSRSSSGTGFFVTSEGHIVTNSHVVTGCSTIEVKSPAGTAAPARLLAQDSTNDLALLKVEQTVSKVASLRVGVRLGEPIAAFGFPFTSVLASSGNFTLGNVTALAGIGDDTRYFQISAPVQPGNSGGPLLDETGGLVGVVTSKLNALRTVAITGDLPQNVNFAIKASALATFLESNRVSFSTDTNSTRLLAPDLAEQATAISVLVRCE